MKKQDKILKKVSPLSKNVKAKLPSKKGAVEKHFLPDHHFKNVKVKKGLNGLGLFAGENIKKGELIIEYIGNILTDKETDKIPDSRYIFSISKSVFTTLSFTTLIILLIVILNNSSCSCAVDFVQSYFMYSLIYCVPNIRCLNCLSSISI